MRKLRTWAPALLAFGGLLWLFRLIRGYWGRWDAVAALATIGLLVLAVLTVLTAFLQLDEIRSSGKLGNLERELDRFDSKLMRMNRKALAEKRLQEDGTLRALDEADAPSELYEVLNFFEHLAFMVRRGYLDLYPTWHSFVHWASAYYCDAQRVIEYEQGDDVTYFPDFVWLVGQMGKENVRQGGKPSTDIEQFYAEERALLV